MGRRAIMNFFVSTIFVAVFLCVPAWAQPTNGDFSSGLDGWTVEFGTVTDGGGYALFEEDWFDISSTLSQEFIIPSQALELSFDVVMSSSEDGGPESSGFPDAFTATLYDNPTDLNPLIATDISIGDDFFYMDNTGFVDTVASFDGMTVSLDISAFRGLPAYLVFDLWGGVDGLFTTAALDNVQVSVIPAPSALLLGCIGTGLTGWFRRKRIK